jgi:uridine phosphorylase
MNSRDIRNKKSIRDIHKRYNYYANVPERGLVIDGRPALTGIDPAAIGETVLLVVRDPLCAYTMDPAEYVASLLDKSELAGKSGMFTTYSGWYRDAHISVVSGGSGSPEAELALYDFMEYTGASTFIRVGGSGGIGEAVRPGDIVISSGVVRDEGMTKAYIDAAYHAASSYEVVLAMVEAAELLGVSYHVGVTLSVDSDFVGGGRPGVGGYMQPWNIEKAGVYDRAGVLNGDRESAAVVTLSSLFGRRGGSVCSVADNIVTGETFTAGAGHDEAIRLVLEGSAILHRMDMQKSAAGKRYWYSDLSKSRGPGGAGGGEMNTWKAMF